MIKITQGGDIVTLINVFSCESQNQQHLIDPWVRATEQMLGKLPGIISAALHRSKDGTRVINYAQWKSSENWENLFQIGSKSWFDEIGSTPNPMLIFTKSVTCWTRRTSRTRCKTMRSVKVMSLDSGLEFATWAKQPQVQESCRWCSWRSSNTFQRRRASSMMAWLPTGRRLAPRPVERMGIAGSRAF
jgi:hypothetical protein